MFPSHESQLPSNTKICSQYIKLLECFESSINEIDHCKLQSEPFLDFVRSIFDDIVNLTCTDYQESNDKCSQLPEPPIKDKSVKRTKSFIMPLMHVWESADQLPKKFARN